MIGATPLPPSDPIKINFQHLWVLIRDAWHADNWKDKFRIWFMPTGWRPEGFDEKYPIHKIDDVYNFNKFGTDNSNKLIYWSVTQMFVTLLFVSYLFDNIAKIGLTNIFVYGAFIFVTIYSYTELMDKHKFSFIWESIRYIFAIAIINYYGDWFGLNTIFSFGNYLVLGYLTVSLLASIYFVSFDFKTENQPILNS